MSPQRGQFPPGRSTTIHQWVKIHSPSFSHPPRPFPLGRGASRPLSSRVQAARRFACFSCPPDGERGVVPRASRVRFASILARSVLGLRPALRVRLPVEPLTPFPLRTASRTRTAGRGAVFSEPVRPRAVREASERLAGPYAVAQRMPPVPRLVRGMASRHYPPPPHPWGGSLAIEQETARPAGLRLDGSARKGRLRLLARPARLKGQRLRTNIQRIFI